MYVRLKSSKRSRHQTLQIVEGIRQGKSVRQRVVASLGIIEDRKNVQKLVSLAEGLARKLEEQGAILPKKLEIEKLSHAFTTYDGFGIVVKKMMEISKFSEIIRKRQGKNSFDVEEVVRLIITQAMDCPSSKRRTCERQQEHGYSDIDLQHLYRAMDVIEGISGEIQTQAFLSVSAIHQKPASCFFFDVTTFYFESVFQDELRDFGFSKDQKHHSVQIVFALVVDQTGIPLAYESFKGNLAETKTLIPVLDSLRARLNITDVTVVCDRGMASRQNIEALQKENFHFVIATKLRSVSAKYEINNIKTYKALPNQDEIPAEQRVLYKQIEHPQYKNATLIATYSPSRAAKDRQDRERLLEKLQEKLEGTSEEGSVKRVINNSGYKKFTTVKEGSLISLNQTAIDRDAAWDGFHGIAVSHSAGLSIQEALTKYKELWHVEETFRVAKTTLRTRPMFHWVPRRIRSHILISFMTLFIERSLEVILKQRGTPLPPDQIRYALSNVHTILLAETGKNRIAKVESCLGESGEKIFQALGIPTGRSVSIQSTCCA